MSISPKRLWIADVMLLLVAVVWGTSYGVAKHALVFYPVLGFLTLRFCLTFIALSPSLLQLRRPEGRAALWAGLPLGLILLSVFICETFGIALTQASNAAFLISLCIVFTPFVEWVVMGQRPPSSAFVVAFIALLGTWLLTLGARLTFNLGDGLILMAALLRALMVCMTKRLTLGRKMATLTLTAVQSGVVGFGSLIIAAVVLKGGLPALPLNPVFWSSTAYLVVFCTIFAFFAQTYAVRRSSPTRVSLLMGSEPLFGALFAAIWLGEKLGTVSWFGGALIVGATLWATLPKNGLLKAATFWRQKNYLN